MTHDVLWLARLGIDQGLFTHRQAVQVKTALGDAAEIGDFAQKFVDDGFVENVEELEKLAGLAMAKGQKGPPASDPFEESESSTVESSGASATAPAIQFPFATLGTMD